MGLRDCKWEVVAFKKEDKSQTEFSFDREKMFSASTLILKNYKTVFVFFI